MKKKLLLGVGLIFGLSSIAMADEYVEARIGLSALGTYNSDNHYVISKEKTKGVGVDLATEFLKSVNEDIYLGGGAAYQVHQDNKSSHNPLFKSVPIYATGKYMIGYIGESAWQTYAKANLGYSFNFKDGGHHKPKDGLYWALGGGIENEGVLLEISYQDTYSEVNHTHYNYSRWTFSVGYRFR